jgi:hypothetical protein
MHRKAAAAAAAVTVVVVVHLADAEVVISSTFIYQFL